MNLLMFGQSRIRSKHKWNINTNSLTYRKPFTVTPNRSVQPGHYVTHAPDESDRPEDPVQDQNDRTEEVLRSAQLWNSGAEQQRGCVE